MKSMILPALGALIALGLASPLHAEDKSTTIFTCSIGKKTASVTLADGRLTYHYGTATHDELSIVGIPASGNVFQMTQRFAGMEYQLRFTNSDHSYIVYTSEGSGRVGATATSGLVVLRGTERISDRACERYTEFSIPLDDLGIPQDTEGYSAM
ncbi:hypothetical protein [Pleomorphomonas sp. PLEO]|uniref:hypothetical protein n=1 Tax=Pleomorphomonas sp. PLEO TaxID=3239306 RepID=UPI00351E2CF1